MANGITGGITVSFGNHENFHVSEERMKKLMNSDVGEATKLKAWDSVKVWFSNSHKQEALVELHRLIHGNHGNELCGSVSVFNKLKALADPVHQNKFNFTCEQIPDPYSPAGKVMTIGFQVGDKVIHTESLKDILLNQVKFNGTDLIGDSYETSVSVRLFEYCEAHKEEFEIMMRNPKTGKPYKLVREKGEVGKQELQMCAAYYGKHTTESLELMRFFDKIHFGNDNNKMLDHLLDEIDATFDVDKARFITQELDYCGIAFEGYKEGKVAIEESNWERDKNDIPKKDWLEKFNNYNISDRQLMRRWAKGIE